MSEEVDLNKEAGAGSKKPSLEQSSAGVVRGVVTTEEMFPSSDLSTEALLEQVEVAGLEAPWVESVTGCKRRGSCVGELRILAGCGLLCSRKLERAILAFLS